MSTKEKLASVLTRINPRRMGTRGLIITGVAALVIGGGGSALAVQLTRGPIDASGVIHGCYTSSAVHGTHTFVLMNAGESCPKGTTAISWNQKGPAGPKPQSTGRLGAFGACQREGRPLSWDDGSC